MLRFFAFLRLLENFVGVLGGTNSSSLDNHVSDDVHVGGSLKASLNHAYYNICDLWSCFRVCCISVSPFKWASGVSATQLFLKQYPSRKHTCIPEMTHTLFNDQGKNAVLGRGNSSYSVLWYVVLTLSGVVAECGNRVARLWNTQKIHLNMKINYLYCVTVLDMTYSFLEK